MGKIKTPADKILAGLPILSDECLQGFHDYRFVREEIKNGRILWHYHCVREGCIQGLVIDVTDALKKTGRLTCGSDHEEE